MVRVSVDDVEYLPRRRHVTRYALVHTEPVNQSAVVVTKCSSATYDIEIDDNP